MERRGKTWNFGNGGETRRNEENSGKLRRYSEKTVEGTWGNERPAKSSKADETLESRTKPGTSYRPGATNNPNRQKAWLLLLG
jgi:hypothetical protein